MPDTKKYAVAAQPIGTRGCFLNYPILLKKSADVSGNFSLEHLTCHLGAEDLLFPTFFLRRTEVFSSPEELRMELARPWKFFLDSDFHTALLEDSMKHPFFKTEGIEWGINVVTLGD